MTDNVFAKAAEILMTEGHTKGVLKDDNSRCAVGALQEAAAAHGEE